MYPSPADIPLAAGINQPLHPVCRILLHLRGHMAVNIQGESDGCVTQVFRYRLDRISDPDGVCRVCVAEVMETGFRNPDLCHNCFQVLQDRVVDQMPACLIYKDKIFFIHPGSAGSQFVFCLLLPDFVQHLHHIRRRLQHPGLVVLRREDLVLAGPASFADLLQLLLDVSRNNS